MKNKIAIVTGGGSGIGRATSIELAERGATVIVSDMNEYSAQKTSGIILEAGNDAIAFNADVGEKSEVMNLVKFTIEKFQKVDIMINNAGIGGPLAFMEDYDDESYEEVIKVNQTGVWYCMKAILPIMKNQESGAIVNVSSVAGISSAALMSAYSASKHAVIGMTRTAATEYSKYGIRINAICPTVIDTEMGRSYIESHPELLEILKGRIPMKRFGTASEVAKFIIWLCCDENSYITGQALPIDGGMTS